jgi:hypothetical protein
MPVVGFLGAGSAAPDAWRVAAFRQGLNESGYVEGRNLGIEFRWADGDYDRLPQLATELVNRSVTVTACCDARCQSRDLKNSNHIRERQ